MMNPILLCIKCLENHTFALHMATPRSIAFHTLGCKLNFSETSAIAQQFEAEGYAVLPFDQEADVYLINTCSVTDFADRKCRKIVRQALRRAPQAKVVVTGCYAQLKPQEIADIPGVDLVLGAGEKFNALRYIDQIEKAPGKGLVRAGEIETVNDFKDAFSFGDRTRSFLKVQDGCEYKCSFCTIPLARGFSRSDTVANVVQNARQLGARGIQEIVLTGVNIGDFRDGDQTFLDLITALDRIDSVARFRISSIEPNLCSDEIIRFVADSERFMPHFHMPLQSGSNKLLRLMRRRYRRELYSDRVNLIRQIMPHACIGVDVIVGFPGETEQDISETYTFLEGLEVSYLHVFTYSERANTDALALSGKVPMEERRKRNLLLRQLSELKKRQFYVDQLGSIRPVLLEKSSERNRLSGFTDNYIKVDVPADLGSVNQMVSLYLGAVGDHGRVEATLSTVTVPN